MDQRKDDSSSERNISMPIGNIEYKSDNRVGELTAQISYHLQEFQSNFYFIKDNLSLEQLENNLNPLEYAGYNAFLAYCLCSLFYSYLKLSGAVLNNHPIKNEIKRVQQLMKQIKETAEDKDQTKMTCIVNREAAKRIIDSCVSYNKNIKKSRQQ